jgi:glycosyltransferase involved in cell wall biosynthesis
MKVVIQIPCFNEESQLAETVRQLPLSIPGVDSIEILVVDDGSIDRTADVARGLGLSVLSVPVNRGLAYAFMAGVEASLSRGADILVNTDADNQYRGEDIANLVAPILERRGDLVVGGRPIAEIESFSLIKKALQRAGSWVVRKVSGTSVTDASSGFRAMSRDAALQINVFSRYTYTLETIVQAAHRGLRVVSVPIRVNKVTRQSRLIRSNSNYVWRTGIDLVRILVVYRPFRSFMLLAVTLFAIATIIALRFVYYLIVSGGSPGHVQSLILAEILYGLCGTLVAMAFIGDLLAINRRLLEELRLEARRAKFKVTATPRAKDA